MCTPHTNHARENLLKASAPDMENLLILCGFMLRLAAETWGRLGQRAADLAKTVEDRITFPVDFTIQHDFTVSSQSKPAQVKWRAGTESSDVGNRSMKYTSIDPRESTGFLPGVGVCV